MSKIRVYVSHSIRGKFGEKATDEQRRANSERAIKFSKLIRKEFPHIDFYIPGEHHEIDTIAYRKGYMTEEQILDIDCVIISRCNFMIVFVPDDFISKGMRVEVDYAILHSIPIISAIDGTYEEYVQKIIHAVNCHLISMLR